MELKVKEHGSTAVISLKGRFMGGPDTDRFMQLCSEQLVKDCFERLVLDLEGLTWVNSSGLGGLISAYTATKETQKQFAVYRVSRRIADIFSHTKLNLVFTRIETLEEVIP